MNAEEAREILKSSQRDLSEYFKAEGYLEAHAQWRERVKSLVEVFAQYQAAIEIGEHIHTSWNVYIEGKKALAEFLKDKPLE